MNIIYDTQSTINENINLRLNGLRLRSETGEGLKNLNGKQIQICMHGFYSFWDGSGLRAGVGAADFLHVRHPIPQSRFASVGGCKPRSRPCGLLANQGGAAVSRSVGPAGVGGSPAVVRVVGESGRGGCPGLPKTRGACLFVRQPGRAVGCRYGCRPARKRRSGRMPGRLRPDARPAGIAWGSQPNRAVGLPERGACCGYGRSAVLAARKK